MSEHLNYDGVILKKKRNPADDFLLVKKFILGLHSIYQPVQKFQNISIDI
jgi:hypothetical protein